MRSGSVLVLLVGLASVVCAQEARFVYPVPAANEFSQQSFVYQQSGQTRLSLDLFLPTPSAQAKPLPLFIIFNGFGGEFMRTSAQAQGWAKAATAHGFAAVTAETTEGHISADFDLIVLYLRQLAGEARIDLERIVVIAWSGNVSEGLPTVEDPRRKAIRAAVIYYGSADVAKVRLDLPVLFVRAGLDQPLTNQNFDRRTAAGIAANAPWTVLNYPAGHHGFDVSDDNDVSREIIEETFHFAQLAIAGSYRPSHQSSQGAAVQDGLGEAAAAGALFTKDFSRAAALYREIVAVHPQDARLLLAYGNALIGAKQYKEARAQFDRAKAIGGLGPRDLGLPAAKACLLDHDPEAAMAWLKTIPPQGLPASIQSDPDFASLRERADFQALFRTH